MSDKNPIYTFEDEFLLTLCLWREARNQKDDAIQAVAHVILNRAAHHGWWGDTIATVVLSPNQFSSFNRTDRQSWRIPFPHDVEWMRVKEIGRQVMSGDLKDNTGGATLYFDKSLDANPPKWALKEKYVKDIGAFHFYLS